MTTRQYLIPHLRTTAFRKTGKHGWRVIAEGCRALEFLAASSGTGTADTGTPPTSVAWDRFT